MVEYNKDEEVIEDKKSIKNLKKLHVLLDDLMGETILGHKYVKSLEKGIKSLEKNKLLVQNSIFRVEVINEGGCITVEVLLHNGEIIDTMSYDCNDIISDSVIGKS